MKILGRRLTLSPFLQLFGQKASAPANDKLHSPSNHSAKESGFVVILWDVTGAEVIDYNRTFSPKEVTSKARILSRPEPTYTEKARGNRVSGKVILRAALSSTGEVTGVRVMYALPYGLTTRAIEAAHRIMFKPAIKDLHNVSQYIQIEYNFNLY